jgi:hypothetical protein
MSDIVVDRQSRVILPDLVRRAAAQLADRRQRCEHHHDLAQPDSRRKDQGGQDR